MDNELKDIWKMDQPDVELSEEKVESIINKKSYSLLGKIIKTVRMEHLFNMILTPLMVGLLIYVDRPITATLAAFLVAPFIIYYQRLLNKLKKNHLELNVHDYLVQSYKQLKAFVRHYQLASIVLIFFSFLIGAQYGFELNSHDEQPLDYSKFLEPWALVTMGITLVFMLVFIYGLIYLLYGRRIKKLRKMVEELEKES